MPYDKEKAAEYEKMTPEAVRSRIQIEIERAKISNNKMKFEILTEDCLNNKESADKHNNMTQAEVKSRIEIEIEKAKISNNKMKLKILTEEEDSLSETHETKTLGEYESNDA